VREYAAQHWVGQAAAAWFDLDWMAIRAWREPASDAGSQVVLVTRSGIGAAFSLPSSKVATAGDLANL